MSKKMLFLLIVLSIISCEGIQYDGEKRLVFQTVVLNANGQPLPKSHIEITVGDSYSTSIISKGETDQNGRITLVFPAPEQNLGINFKVYNDDTSYFEKGVVSILKSDFENYKFVYQNCYLLKLEETASLQLGYNQTSANTIVTKVGINGIYTMTEEFYNFNPDVSENYFPPLEILIKKNQAFQLKYTVYNTQTEAQTNHVVDLTIGETPLNYTINY